MDMETRQGGPLTARAEDAPQLIDQLRVMMLRRMVLMMTTLPQGAYTECKVDLSTAPGGGVFKLRDLAAALKDLAAITGTGKAGPAADDPGAGIEDWGPLRDMGLIDE